MVDAAPASDPLPGSESMKQPSFWPDATGVRNWRDVEMVIAVK